MAIAEPEGDGLSAGTGAIRSRRPPASGGARLGLPILLALLVFAIALSVRLVYLQNSVPRLPIRADARLYVAGAINLRDHGVYSNQWWAGNGPPSPTAIVPPGYSLLLWPFVDELPDTDAFYRSVTAVQALLGAATAALGYLLAALMLGRGAALVVGGLITLSPHLIALTGNLLSETLFGLCLVSAVLVCGYALRSGKTSLFFAAGLLFGMSALVRPIALLLLPFVLLGVLFSGGHRWFTRERRTWAGALAMLLGFAVIEGPYLVRNAQIPSGEGSTSSRAWENFLMGTYPDFTHQDAAWYGYPYRDDELYSRMYADPTFAWRELNRRFRADPGHYLSWYGYGKLVGMWQWDLKPGGSGDVYVYPMERYGFEVEPTLAKVREVMQFLHTPLLWLAALGGVLVAAKLRMAQGWQYRLLLVCASVLIYHIALLTVLFPIPRLTLPLRPYLFILSVYALTSAAYTLRPRLAAMTQHLRFTSSQDR